MIPRLAAVLAATLALMLAAGIASGASAAACRDVSFEGLPYTVCEAKPGADLRLFLNGPDGNLGSFEAVNRLLAAQGKALVFAMNAGMYHPDRRPVGLYTEEGHTMSSLVTTSGGGNFGLVPNGVFCIGTRFAVIETRAYARARMQCRFATQSGPLLVISGKLHPRFLADSPSTYIRNGVGVTPDGRAVFAISGRAVNFHTFARFFRDVIGAPDALYLDGSISRLYAPDLGRNDFGFAMGPIVGLVAPKG
ncbi:MAG: phosphodiester glycosidase family protein [Paracoccaceae bacterium]